MEMIKNPQLKRSKSLVRYHFGNSNFLTFGSFDVFLRPGWDRSLRVKTAEEKTTAERRKRMQRMKDQLAELNAITATVKEVLMAYTGEPMCYLKDKMSFSVPIFLNNHEIHAWRTVKNLLYTYGESFSLSHMEELGAICGLVDSSSASDSTHNKKETTPMNARLFREEHPEIFHFVCYCNLLLGGTKSFASAKFMLLRDFAMLLKFIQQVRR